MAELPPYAPPALELPIVRDYSALARHMAFGHELVMVPSPNPSGTPTFRLLKDGTEVYRVPARYGSKALSDSRYTATRLEADGRVVYASTTRTP